MTLTTIYALPDITPHEGAIFQQQGYLIGGLSWAHITAPINITQMEEDVNKYQNFVEYFDALAKPIPGGRAQISDDERRRMVVLKRLCERRMNKMNTVIKDLQADLGIDFALDVNPRKTTRTDQDHLIRNKRQVIIGLAAIGGLIVGAITGSLFSQFKTTALIDILNQKVDTIVHQFDNLSIGVHQDHQDIKQINKTFATFENLIGSLIHKDQSYDHYFAEIYSTLLMEEQSERFALAETASDQLQLGKLHKGLIAPDGLKMALDDLTRRAQARGLLVGVRRPLELYQLHTSFLFNQETGILHAIIHIPMYRESHVLTLKRYIPFLRTV